MQNVHSRKTIVFLGLGILTLGIFVLLSNYFNEKVDNAYSYMNNLLLTSNEIFDMQEEVDNLSDATSSFQEKIEDNNDIKKASEGYVEPYEKYYIGRLEIPKINLNKGFTSIDSPYNTVNKNIQVVKGSSYPDVSKGNFIIAAHSGSSYLGYFKNLYKLVNGDVAYVNYNGKRYTYRIVNIYEQEKTGKIVIYRNGNKNCLTLVTCTKNSKTKQTVYILELENVENI